MLSIAQLTVPPEQLTCTVAVRKKSSKMTLVFLKLLLNRKESEKVFYMKQFGLIDSFPTVYHTRHSDKRFKNFFHKNFKNSFDENSLFWILFKNHKDFDKMINMKRFPLFNSYPTVYHLRNSDKRLKSYEQNTMQKTAPKKVPPDS